MTATKGLEGVVVTTSSISSIQDGVLLYRGYNIDDLVVQANVEKVAYLLWFGKLANQSELINLHTELDHHAVIPECFIEHMKCYI